MPPKRDVADTVQLKIRVKEPLREQIEQSARERGLSLSAEIVDRLEKSFERQMSIQDIFGSNQVFEIMKIIASTMNVIGRTAYYQGNRVLDANSLWLSDPHAYNEAFEAAVTVLEAMRPPGEIVVPKAIAIPGGPTLSYRGIGARTAQANLEDIAASQNRADVSAKVRRAVGISEPPEPRGRSK